MSDKQPCEKVSHIPTNPTLRGLDSQVENHWSRARNRKSCPWLPVTYKILIILKLHFNIILALANIYCHCNLV